MVVGGCTLAGLGDLDFNQGGYGLAILCAALQSAYILLVEALGAESTSAGEMMYYNSLTAIPLLMATVFYHKQWLDVVVLFDFARHIKGAAAVGTALGLMAVAEFALNGSLILCTVTNSGLTTSVVGVLKGVVAALLGFFLLGGVKFSALNVTGICVAMAGGLVYVLVKQLGARAAGEKGGPRVSGSGGGGGSGGSGKALPR